MIKMSVQCYQCFAVHTVDKEPQNGDLFHCGFCGATGSYSITETVRESVLLGNEQEEVLIEESVASRLKDYVECPNCFEGESSWIYQCDECGFTGCYDGVYENGCYEGREDVRMCPKCDGKQRTKWGKVEAGSVEECE